jgi:hypothetical protein
MDSGFVPSEIVVRHFVSHKFTLELGPSITSLGKPIRTALFVAIVIFCAGDIVRATLQAVLKQNRGDTEP